MYGNDDVSNAYLPGMVYNRVFIAHHQVRQGLTRRNIRFLPGSFQASPRFLFGRIYPEYRNKTHKKKKGD